MSDIEQHDVVSTGTGITGLANQPELSDEDVYAAMKDIEGYLDISMRDFRELYSHAIRHARQRLLTSTLIKDIMTRDVVHVAAGTTFEGVIQAMASRSISGLPVIDAREKVVGVVSEKDIFSRLEGDQNASFWKILGNCLNCNRCLMRSLMTVTAGDIMSTPAVTIGATESAHAALQLFSLRKINRLPVVDTDGLLVGIVTRTNLLQASLQVGEE
ncbi:CBS domain-containing protein [Desulfopila aestuarii]|uniref:CBS domain-containing protein n=1 Tax=Desulfopila aestuarii DSM 18488 TaxID=1121416 RepID=A0A1M7YCR7_9BACT|nr:CBS domain-containing protein [Desulfopila aestuarii]SHO50434.1 CBS domain-containing protein [Desulfopila aestuarii DSM 18488]